jgi:hypothetical protein
LSEDTDQSVCVNGSNFFIEFWPYDRKLTPK